MNHKCNTELMNMVNLMLDTKLFTIIRHNLDDTPEHHVFSLYLLGLHGSDFGLCIGTSSYRYVNNNNSVFIEPIRKLPSDEWDKPNVCCVPTTVEEFVDEITQKKMTSLLFHMDILLDMDEDLL